MKILSLIVVLTTVAIILFACNDSKDAAQATVKEVNHKVDSVQNRTTSTTVLRAWPLDVFLNVNHSMEYDGTNKGEVEKYYSNAKTQGSYADTTLIVFRKYLVLIIYGQEGNTYYNVYDYLSGLIDTSQNRISLPVFPKPRCSFAYSSDEMTNLQSIWNNKLFMVANPEYYVPTLDIYDLKDCTVKHIANEKESIVGDLIIKGDNLYLFKINGTLQKEEEYVINLNTYQESKTGKQRMITVE